MLYVIAEVLCGQRAPTGAPWVRKFGNLVIREKWLGRQHTSVRPPVPRGSWEGGGGWESKGNLRGGGAYPLFLAGNRVLLLGNQRFSWWEIA